MLQTELLQLDMYFTFWYQYRHLTIVFSCAVHGPVSLLEQVGAAPVF